MAGIKVDIFLGPKAPRMASWNLGTIHEIVDWSELASVLSKRASRANVDYFLLWNLNNPVPEITVIQELVASGVDLVHAGLKLGYGDFFPDLYQIKQDWSMVDASAETRSSSWRMCFDACLIRAVLLNTVELQDPGYKTLSALSLDYGLRCMMAGALIEHAPNLVRQDLEHPDLDPDPSDYYLFLLRFYGKVWTVYAFIRKFLSSPIKGVSTIKCFSNQIKNTGTSLPVSDVSVWFDDNEMPAAESVNDKVSISVVIPTIGRYPYLRKALNSLRFQSLRPSEIIVVDQNYIEDRQLDFYAEFSDLPLQVIWQNERGQSLARNTGVLQAKGAYIFLFDDDSIADPKLLENHFLAVELGRLDVSTGVAVPPEPEDYHLPPSYRYPRIAQTLDTGNSLLPRDLYLNIGGLDRNYDFGPGTDADLGIRLYLSGYRILHNPSAIRVHFKAPIGGLRLHGAKKYNTDAGLIDPFPPVTQSYYCLRYLSKKQTHARIWLQYFTIRFPPERRNRANGFRFLLDLIKFACKLVFLPIKKYRSLQKARKMLVAGVRLMDTRIAQPYES